MALADVAEATADVVADGGWVGESVMLTGPEAIDMYQVAADFSAVLGKEIPFQDMSEDDFANMVIGIWCVPGPRDARDASAVPLPRVGPRWS